MPVPKPLALVLLVLTALLVPAPPATAAFPGANGKIVFVGENTTQGAEIYVMNPDGTGRTRLTHDAFFDTSPAFSSDGRKIAYASARGDDYEIFVMRADGTGKKRITFNQVDDGQPAFSPNGKKIVFASAPDFFYDAADVVLMRADGTGRTRLTTRNGVGEFGPSFAPDGSRIVFSRAFDEYTVAIYTMDPDGTDKTRLADDAGGEPSFAPDGQKIAFTRLAPGGEDVWVMNADGSHQAQLTDSYDNDTEAAFSPNGKKIAFRSNRDPNPGIYVMDADGTDQTPLDVPGGEPDWGPRPGAKAG